MPTPRSIDPNPALSVLLEPRSLIITTDELYTQHLHGIDGINEDLLAAHSDSISNLPNIGTKAVRVANWKMIVDPQIVEVVKNGGDLKRGTRTSLTCRVVERVVGGSGGLLSGRLGGKR